MHERDYLRFLYIAALMSWLGSSYIFFLKSPDSPAIIGLFIFSLAVSLFLTFLLIVATMTKKLMHLPHKLPITDTLRRSFLLTIFVVGILVLSLYHLLNIFDASALFFTLLFSESFFHAKFNNPRVQG